MWQISKMEVDSIVNKSYPFESQLGAINDLVDKTEFILEELVLIVHPDWLFVD